MAYETFEHTADIGIRGIGKTLEQAFEEGAKAMFSVMYDINSVKPAKELKVKLKAKDREALFVEWLNRLLAEKEISGLIFSKFKVEFQGDKLIGSAWGEKFNAKKHKAETEVKAATYSQLKITEEKGKYIAQCIVDV